MSKNNNKKMNRGCPGKYVATAPKERPVKSEIGKSLTVSIDQRFIEAPYEVPSGNPHITAI